MIPGFNVLFAVFAIVALNLTMFAVALQMDLLIIDSDLAKVVAWAAAVGAWHMVWKFRHYPRPAPVAKRTRPTRSMRRK